MTAPLGQTSLHVRRAKRGDETSLAWMVGRFTPLLLAQARYRIGAALSRRWSAEDVVQDVWCVALPSLAGLVVREGRETPTLLAFLSRTLLYRVNDLTRRQIRRDRIAEFEPASRISRLPAATVGVVSGVARDEGRGRVLAAIDALPERDRAVVVLRAIEQLSNERVAELLGQTPNAVSLRYNRALERLRRELPGSLFEEL